MNDSELTEFTHDRFGWFYISYRVKIQALGGSEEMLNNVFDDDFYNEIAVTDGFPVDGVDGVVATDTDFTEAHSDAAVETIYFKRFINVRERKPIDVLQHFL